MMSFLFRCAMAVFGFGSLYLISDQTAYADNWGCEVILCLSNPGGPMQYTQCRPPVQKLWRELARGKSFPTCSGVGFKASRPGYDPFYCNGSYRLTISHSDRGRKAACVSSSRQILSRSLCRQDRNEQRNSSKQLSDAQWQSVNGQLRCMGYTTARPLVREQPNYIDVTIDGAGKQRVWF
ncbi:hypothetical protein [Ochrobactrum sp. MYb379]|uniref:hypothetical protein n=1 Tax=Ochrobactrum sp. MYb379 TaxID=2745275 RepID=UPI00403F221A